MPLSTGVFFAVYGRMRYLVEAKGMPYPAAREASLVEFTARLHQSPGALDYVSWGDAYAFLAEGLASLEEGLKEARSAGDRADSTAPPTRPHRVPSGRRGTSRRRRGFPGRAPADRQ